MAKKDTYLALLRRGIDETTAQQLADSGLKIGDLKKIDKDMLIENYGLKSDIADGVISIITAGPQSHGKERYLSKVLAPERKQESKPANQAGIVPPSLGATLPCRHYTVWPGARSNRRRRYTRSIAPVGYS